MKIAIPTKNQSVDSHFGQCDHYTIFTIDESKKIESTEEYDAPVGCGCKSDVAALLKAKGVETMLAGNMGQGAVNKVTEAGIQVIRGCQGNIETVVKQYLTGFILDSGLICSHTDGDDHQCAH
jgi:predicted Fe-Mo cluster-binding NifX family protein